MGLFSLLGVLSPAHIGLTTLLTGAQRTGTDPMGNRYYRAKPRKGYKRERRWVLYKGAPEASKVPPEWHGWLHYQTDKIPEATGESYRREWQKPHTPNLTGTAQAYRPKGYALNNSPRAKASADYEAWTPSKGTKSTAAKTTAPAKAAKATAKPKAKSKKSAKKPKAKSS